MSDPRFVVFVSDHCSSCDDALSIAEKVRERYPGLEVETFNVDRRRAPPAVFATPTYMLGDRIAFLGNPTDEQLWELLGKPAPTGRA